MDATTLTKEEIVVSAKVGRASRQVRQERLWFVVFIAPWFIGFLALTVYPMIASAYYSLTDYSVLSPPNFIGFRNYSFLFHNNLFWQSAKVTVIYAACTVVIQLVLGLLTAMMLNMRIFGMRFLRTVYYLPNVLPVASTSMLWIFLFLPQCGLIDSLIRKLSGSGGPQWLTDPAWALTALIIMSAWGIGSAMLIFLAGLQSIPHELYEAAELDGASSMARLFHITVPMLSPQILLNLIMGLIGAFQTFVQSYMMTNGGPDYATYLYSLSIYQNAFQSFRMGLASAQAWILFIVILILTGVIFKTSARWVYYGGAES